MRPDNSISSSAVFCDGFAVTYSPDDSPRDDLAAFVQSIGFDLAKGSGPDLDLWRGPSGGLVRFDAGARHHRVAVSGKGLAHIRGWQSFHALLTLLSETNHRVTLIDAALDLPIDAPPVLTALRKRFPSSAPLTRKSIETWWLMGSREDGQETGTFYVGKRGKSKVQARVYDKQHELLKEQRIETGPTTRYEISVRGKLGPTLRDVALPASMFWHFASPALLQAPSGVEPWESGRGGGWTHERRSGTPWEALKLRIDSSPDLGALIQLADTLGASGREEMLRLIARRLGIASPASVT